MPNFVFCFRPLDFRHESGLGVKGREQLSTCGCERVGIYARFCHFSSSGRLLGVSGLRVFIFTTCASLGEGGVGYLLDQFTLDVGFNPTLWEFSFESVGGWCEFFMNRWNLNIAFVFASFGHGLRVFSFKMG